MKLPSPAEIKKELPLTIPNQIASWRGEAIRVLERSDPRLCLIVGPCSIHDESAVLEYATRLKQLTSEINESFFPIIRLFFEKPRTQLGWKGMLYDPFLDGSDDIGAGIRKSRELILQIAKLGLPCATELLEPLVLPYFDDLIVWGLIGARTVASQPHRQLASGLRFPVGFKNDLRGDVDVAVAAILASRIPHSRIGIDDTGHIAKIQTSGNPFTHLVLRGSNCTTNYDADSIEMALKTLQGHHLEPRLIIDCSHGNCGKDPLKQKAALECVIKQNNPNVVGIMLESHLLPGRQILRENPRFLSYGVSITDPCLGWEDTEELLRSTSMSLVQKWCSQVSNRSPA